MKKSKIMTATSLRAILVIILLIAIGATGYGFYQAQIWLKKYATTVGQTIGSSSSGTMSSDGLLALEQVLASRQSSIDKAATVTVLGANYQSQAISDLTVYANKTGINITNYSVSDTTPTSAGIAGITPKYLSVTLQNPIKTDSLLQFLSLVETNLPKMQITGISLSQSSDITNINVDPLIVELYTE